MKIPQEKVREPEWAGRRTTFVEWTSLGTKWLAEASKLAIHSEQFRQPQVPVEPKYQTILSAQRAIAHMKRCYCITSQQGASLRRKLQALEINVSSLEVEAALDLRLKTYMEETRREALAEWRRRVHAWGIQQKDVFKCLRNCPPAKAAMIMLPLGPTTHPYAIQRALHEYWSNIETWPPGTSEETAIECLEDEYLIFLPNSPTTIQVTGQAEDKNIKGPEFPHLAWTGGRSRNCGSYANKPYVIWLIYGGKTRFIRDLQPSICIDECPSKRRCYFGHT